MYMLRDRSATSVLRRQLEILFATLSSVKCSSDFLAIYDNMTFFDMTTIIIYSNNTETMQ